MKNKLISISNSGFQISDSCPHTSSRQLLFSGFVLSALLWGAWTNLRAQTNGAEELTFLTLAGPSEAGPGAIDGVGSAARFSGPTGLAVDSAGNLYVADSGNHTIRKVSATGAVTTLAGRAGEPGSADGTGGMARFNSPLGVAVDDRGNVYVADSGNATIRKISPAGTVTTLAGLAGSEGCEDGTGSAARFRYPRGVALDSAGNIYVTGGHGWIYSNSCGAVIRKISPAGVVTTLLCHTSEDPSSLENLDGVAIDSAGNVYAAQVPALGGGRIWKIGPGGEAQALPAFGSSSGGLALDSAGNVYAPGWDAAFRKINPAGVVTTVLGVDPEGKEVRFAGPAGIAVDSAGNVYVAHEEMIHKITPQGLATPMAGNETYDASASVDGTGSAARFVDPQGIAVDSGGNVYVADWGNTIRKISPRGVVTTIAGSAGVYAFADGTGSAARFCQPTDVAVDAAGNIFVADWGNNTIRKISPQGVVTTLAGNTSITDQWGRPAAGHADGPGSVARFNRPRGIAVDTAGNVYVAEQNNHTIRKISPAGFVTTLAGNSLIKNKYGDPERGYADGTGSAARFNSPLGVAVDDAGNVYVADSGNQLIRKITPGGVVTSVAGLCQDNDGDGWPDGGYADGTGRAARFNWPLRLAMDHAGNLYVTDNGMLRKISPTGVVTTVAGQAGTRGCADGTGRAARFIDLWGIAMDGAGNLYVVDSGAGNVRISSPETCPDRPVVDLGLGPVGVTRQLDTSPHTATAWQWSLIRRPANSIAELSSATIRNPTFTPDVADLFVFRLRTTNASEGLSVRTVELMAVPANVAVLSSPQRLPDGSFQLILIGQTNQSYTLQVSTDLSTWTDWTNATPASFTTPLTDAEAPRHAQRFYRAVKAR